MFRGPPINIIDDKSIYVGTTKADCIGGESDQNHRKNNDGEPDPYSYEHIKGIVSKILQRNAKKQVTAAVVAS